VMVSFIFEISFTAPSWP